MSKYIEKMIYPDGRESTELTNTPYSHSVFYKATKGGSSEGDTKNKDGSYTHRKRAKDGKVYTLHFTKAQNAK